MQRIRPGLVVWPFALIATFSHAESVAPKVSLVQPQRRDLMKWIKLPATVEADAEVMLYAKVSGFLKDFTVDVGDLVKPGQLIGKLDAPELEQDVLLAEAQHAAAEADLQAAKVQLERVGVREQEINSRQKELEAELLKAKAEADRARREYERTQRLFSGEAATDREREHQEFSAKMLDAAVKVAESRLASLGPERELWKKDVEAAKSALEAARSKSAVARAAVERARVWLAYTEIKVPPIGTHAGSAATITKRFVTNGDLITGGAGARTGLQPMVTLTVTDPVRVITEVPENESVHLTAGTSARIGIRALPGEKALSGRVARTGGTLSSSSRTLRVEIDLPNAGGRAKPGMMAEVELATDVKKAVLAVPATCVLRENQAASVFTIESGKAKKVAIKTGLVDSGWVEILDPTLTENTPLIAEVGPALTDGTPVVLQQP